MDMGWLSPIDQSFSEGFPIHQAEYAYSVGLLAWDYISAVQEIFTVPEKVWIYPKYLGVSENGK